ncbi:hypothetical protein D3C87_1038460 [compost metagenome]
MDEVLLRLKQRDGVMVGPGAAPVQTQEGGSRAIPISLVDHQVGRQHAEHALVPVQMRGHVLHAYGGMAKAQHLRRPFSRTLDIAEALLVLRRIEGQCRAQVQRTYRFDAMHQFEPSTGRVMQHHALPSSRALQCLDRRCTRQAGCLQQVVVAFDGERDGAKAGLGSFLGDVHIRQRTAASQVQPLLGAVHHHKAEISQETLDQPEVGMSVDHVIDVFYLQHDSCSSAFNGRNSAPVKIRTAGFAADRKTVGRLFRILEKLTRGLRPRAARRRSDCSGCRGLRSLRCRDRQAA